MNEIKIFNHEEFGEIRTIEIDGQVWFVGADVAKTLGYKKTRNAILDHVDPEDRMIFNLNTALNQGGIHNTITNPYGIHKKGNPNVILINESGVYSLVFASTLQGAKKFKRWVTSEVLPEIRRTGTYGGLSVEKVISRELEEKIESIVTNAINEKLEEIMTQNVTDTVNTLIPGFSILYGKIDTLEKNIDIKKLVSIIENISAIVSERNKGKIENLPQEVRNQIDEMIISGKYSCQKIADFITENADIEISYMTVNRYKKRYFIIK